MIRSFGVKEWEQGISEGQFNEVLADDTCDDYENVRGDINDGRSKVKMGSTSSFPKGIQPDHGDPVRTPRGTTRYVKLDPLGRTHGAVGKARNKTCTPAPMGGTLLPERRALPDPQKAPEGEEALRGCLGVIQTFIEEKGTKGTFEWLDKNGNSYLTYDDLQDALSKERVSKSTAQALCNFLDHNGDGNVSFKDFMTSMAEAARLIPDNHPSMGSMTRKTGREALSPDMLYTRRYDHGMGNINTLQVPCRHTGRRRHHDAPDGIVGVSKLGAAGALQPRADSPSFMDTPDQMKRKSTPYVARRFGSDNSIILGGLGKVHGWQQELVETDHRTRNELASGRQSAMRRLRETQGIINQRTSDRRDARKAQTVSLKADQRFRYFRTVCDDGFE